MIRKIPIDRLEMSGGVGLLLHGSCKGYDASKIDNHSLKSEKIVDLVHRKLVTIALSAIAALMLSP